MGTKAGSRWWCKPSLRRSSAATRRQRCLGLPDGSGCGRRWRAVLAGVVMALAAMKTRVVKPRNQAEPPSLGSSLPVSEPRAGRPWLSRPPSRGRGGRTPRILRAGSPLTSSLQWRRLLRETVTTGGEASGAHAWQLKGRNSSSATVCCASAPSADRRGLPARRLQFRHSRSRRRDHSHPRSRGIVPATRASKNAGHHQASLVPRPTRPTRPELKAQINGDTCRSTLALTPARR